MLGVLPSPPSRSHKRGREGGHFPTLPASPLFAAPFVIDPSVGRRSAASHIAAVTGCAAFHAIAACAASAGGRGDWDGDGRITVCSHRRQRHPGDK